MCALERIGCELVMKREAKYWNNYADMALLGINMQKNHILEAGMLKIILIIS